MNSALGCYIACLYVFLAVSTGKWKCRGLLFFAFAISSGTGWRKPMHSTRYVCSRFRSQTSTLHLQHHKYRHKHIALKLTSTECSNFADNTADHASANACSDTFKAELPGSTRTWQRSSRYSAIQRIGAQLHLVAFYWPWYGISHEWMQTMSESA